MKFLRSFIIFIYFFIIYSSSIEAKKNNNFIVAKIGQDIITQYELINEIRSTLFINNEQINQESINRVKEYALNSLVERSIKKIEIKKYKVNDYSKKDLNNYVRDLAKRLNFDLKNINDVFSNNNLDYELLQEAVITNLKWNTLIFRLYKNQISVNVISIENMLKQEVEKKIISEVSLSEIVLPNTIDKTELKKIISEINKNGFENSARIYSKSETAYLGGSLGWISAASLSNMYLKEIEGLEKNDITNPIFLTDSIVIFKVNDKRLNEIKDEDVKRIKDEIINRSKQEKLNLFSRTHLTNKRNSIFIKMNE